MGQMCLKCWLFIIGGGLIIGLAGIFATYGWNNLNRSKHKLKCWLLIVGGGLFITIGGICATNGWNLLDRHKQKKTLIVGITHEWEINEKLRNDPLFMASEDAVLKSWLLYPRFKRSALNSVLTSGLFNSKIPRERSILIATANYETTIADVNSRLESSDNFVLSTSDKEAIKKHRLNIPKSEGFQSFVEKHKLFYELIERDYKWALASKFLDQ